MPPGASCTPAGDNLAGNGGVHFYDLGGLSTAPAGTPEEAFAAYASKPSGGKAIYRAPIRTQPRATVCTAHVFQQIPGENRIFMGWYSQGTQVIDFVENADGTVRFAEAGHFIPTNANEWVSHVFKVERHPDGSETYYGATGDFALGEAGRNSIDVYKVTLPPAPKVIGGEEGPGTGDGPSSGAGDCALEISGSAKRDKLLGSIGGDKIKGRGGRDKVKGRAGNDCLGGGGGGKDKVKGGGGKDKLSGRRAVAIASPVAAATTRSSRATVAATRCAAAAAMTAPSSTRETASAVASRSSASADHLTNAETHGFVRLPRL